MNKIVVNIPEELSLYVEKLFYEHNSYLNIVKFLIDNNKPKEYIDSYMEQAVQKDIELEIAKRDVSSKYTPNAPVKNYTFDFYNSTLIFDVEEEEVNE